MRKYTKIACLIIFSILLLGLATYSYAAKIAIVTNVDNPDYKNCRETFEREIKREGPANGIDIDFVYLDTKGDKAAFISGVNNLAAEVDLFFVAGTPNALAIKEAGVTKPVLFNAIAGPVGAKLVNSLEAPGTNFTGVHCAVPEDRQLRALLLAVPNVRRIGLLYNPSDPAPAGQAKKWKDAIMGKEGLEIREFFIPETVNSAEALAEVTRALVGQVDVIVSTADAKVSPYGEGMINVANENNIPTYTSLTSLVKKGALVSLGFDFAEGAKVSVKQAILILKGNDPAGIPVSTFPQYKLVLNLKTAQELNLDFTLESVKTASEIIKD